MLLCLPDSTYVRITLKDLNVQPSFPKMNGSSYATDTCANDADGLDVEVSITHGSKHFLVRCMLSRCDRERSKMRRARVIRDNQRDHCKQNNECDEGAIS